jgi:thioredoxin 1
VIEVTDSNFEEVVLRADRPVIVDFWAPWCGPCVSVTRILEELEREHGDRVLFAKLDIDADPVHASRLGVLSIPTAILFDGGEAKETVVGARPRATFERAFGHWFVG